MSVPVGGRAARGAKRTVERVSWALCRLRRNRRVPVPSGHPVLVNVGSGLVVADGWINVDSSPHALFAPCPSPLHRAIYKTTSAGDAVPLEEYLRRMRRGHFVHHDAVYGLPFADASVNVVYSSHFLEHLHRVEGGRLVAEMYRVLKPEGLLRLTVPDLRSAFDLYATGRTEEALEFFFTPSSVGRREQHRYLYDFETLRQTLTACGFVKVQRCAFRTGRCPDLDVLDNRPEQTLFVEAEKAPAAGC